MLGLGRIVALGDYFVMRRAFIVVLLVIVCYAAAQNTEPGEVQVSSQPYPPPAKLPTFRANATLVDVGVVVRDANGHAIGGLKQEDFQVLEDGKRRRITAFSTEQSPAAATLAGATPVPQTSAPGVPIPAAQTAAPVEPRSIALLFDDIHTSPGDLAGAKLAARQFLASAAPGDRIALFTTSSAQTLDFTSDHDKVLAAVAKVESRPVGSEKGTLSCSEMSPYQAYLIANDLDMSAVIAVLEDKCTCPPSSKSITECSMIGARMTDAHFSGTDPDLVEVEMEAEQIWQRTKALSQNTLATIRGVISYLGRQPGKRMLVLASGGFMSETLERDTDVLIDQAIRTGVVVNTLDVKGLRAKTEDRNPGEEMRAASSLATHAFLFNAVTTSARLDSLDAPLATLALGTGGLFFHNNNDLNLGFREIGGIPQTTYLLGFPPRTDGKYHKLKVKVRGHKAEFVQARPGYFAPTKQQEAAFLAAAAPNPLDQEFTSGAVMSEVPAKFTVEAAGKAVGKPIMSVAVHVDLDGLKFKRVQDRRVQRLTFIAALLDAKGNVIAGKEGEMALALKDDTFDRLKKSGITARMFLQAPPGHYRLREVVRESGNGRMSASSEEVELPLKLALAATKVAANTVPSVAPAPAFDQQTQQHPTPPSPTGESAESFLQRAKDQAHEYIEQFADLTAEEHRSIQLFDAQGVPTMSRTMVSALVVYRLQSDQSRTVEYRDVEMVDGKPVKDHAQRAVKIWKEVSAIQSADDEEKRIVQESERYDIGFAPSGFTLFQGLPLGIWCQGAFQLQERGSETVNGHETRVFYYRQVQPCDQVHYALAVPPAFRNTITQSGRLWLDAKTAQLVREDRNVEVGTGGEKWRAVHFRFDYVDSNFGLLLPAAIHIEMYAPQMRDGTIMHVPMIARLAQTYGPFSRFEVHVEQKAAVPAKSN